MTTLNRSRFLLTCLVAGGTCCLLLGYAVAGPVVQSADSQTAPDVQAEPSASSSVQTPSAQTEEEKKKAEEEQKKEAARSGRTSTAPPTATAAPPAPSFSPDSQSLPLPPPYAPGAPGGPSPTTNPYGMMPSAPTAFGPYGAPSAPTPSPGLGTGTPGSGLGWGGTAPPMGYGMPPAGGGYGVPPSPTQPMSLGGAAMADPSFGRYESMNIRDATGVRQPANIGESQARVLQGGKPFSGWRPSSAYSPYMRLNDFSTVQSPGINPYYQWVKPRLDQQEENRVLSRDIQGLTDTARAGYQAGPSTGQRPGNAVPLTGPRAPATFMNTGQYYPDPYAR